MKIQDHLALTEGIVKINARKFFLPYTCQKYFSSLREQSNYKRFFFQPLFNCTIPPMLPVCPAPHPHTLCVNQKSIFE